MFHSTPFWAVGSRLENYCTTCERTRLISRINYGRVHNFDSVLVRIYPGWLSSRLAKELVCWVPSSMLELCGAVPPGKKGNAAALCSEIGSVDFKDIKLHRFLNTFSQLLAVKKYSKNGAAGKFFGPSYFETALEGQILFFLFLNRNSN